ncbi:MAG: hypothetical protein AB8G05_10395 [Oligoflexales bacterium]
MEEMNIGHDRPGQDSTKLHQAPEMLKKRRRSSADKYRSFAEAKEFAKSLNLKSRKEWREYVKGLKPETQPQKPEDVPAHPDGIYKTKGWLGWRNWLGTDKPNSTQQLQH